MESTKGLTIINPKESSSMIRKMAEDAISNKLLPTHIKTPEQAVIMASFGQSWGMDFWETMKGVYVINQTPALTAGALHNLIRKAGHHFEIERDYSILYETDDPRNLYLRGEIVIRQTAEGKDYKSFIPIDGTGIPDRVTTLACYSEHSQKFAERFKKEPKPEYVSFRLNDAVRAQLILRTQDGQLAAAPGKDVWLKWTQNMMFARAISEANRKVFMVAPNAYLVEELDDKGEFVDATLED